MMVEPLHVKDWSNHATRVVINELVERAQKMPTDQPAIKPKPEKVS